jgi:putative transcriptional regulator
VRDFDPTSHVSLAGSLLIAHPGLRDPNFARTVLFISSHDSKDGALGIILNRPSGRSVGDVLPNKPIGALAQVPLLLGGPVQQDQLTFASFHWSPETERMECKHHLLIPEAQEALEEEHTVVRAFIGYAGWGGGQLEEELAHRSWLVGKPWGDLLAGSPGPALWRNVTSTFGPWFKLVAEAPDDPSGN